MAVDRVAQEMDLLHEEFPLLWIGALGTVLVEGAIVAGAFEDEVLETGTHQIPGSKASQTVSQGRQAS